MRRYSCERGAKARVARQKELWGGARRPETRDAQEETASTGKKDSTGRGGGRSTTEASVKEGGRTSSHPTVAIGNNKKNGGGMQGATLSRAAERGKSGKRVYRKVRGGPLNALRGRAKCRNSFRATENRLGLSYRGISLESRGA